MAMITEIETYFERGCGRCARFATPDCSVRRWSDGVLALRALCLGAGLEETVRWGHPCYRHAGRNLALIGAFRGDFRLTFMNAALLADPEGVLEPAGPQSSQPVLMRFSAPEDVTSKAAIIRAYLAEAKGHAEAGRKPEKRAPEVQMPQELIDVLDSDSALADAFAALTPGRQRSYAINLNGAKAPATRIARIAKFRDKILAGKGALER